MLSLSLLAKLSWFYGTKWETPYSGLGPPPTPLRWKPVSGCPVALGPAGLMSRFSVSKRPGLPDPFLSLVPSGDWTVDLSKALGFFWEDRKKRWKSPVCLHVAFM